MKKSKTNKFLIRRIVVVIIIFILIMICRNVFFKLKIKNQQKELCLLYNNETIELQKDIHIEDEVVYISKEDVQNIFDSTIYYNVGDKELITTYNKHVAVLHLDEKQMIVNDSNLDMQGTLKEIDNDVYLPITDLQIVYDLEVNYSEDTNIVTMDSTTKAKSQALVIKKAGIKSKKKFLSPNITKVKIGEYVTIIEDLGKYKKVRTQEGIIGYIKNSKIADIEVLRKDWIDEELQESDFIEAFIINEESTKIQKVSEAFMTYTQRNTVINELYNEVINGQHYFVCINFKDIDDINSFYRFIIELTPKFNESGIKVAVKLNKQIDEDKIKNVVDFVY